MRTQQGDRKKLINAEEAERIYHKYCDALERLGKLGGVVAPISILPFSKDKIKAAIKKWLSVETRSQVRSHLIISCTFLADFVDDNEARFAINMITGMRKADFPPRPGTKKFSNWLKNWEKMVEIYSKRAKQAKALLNELRPLCPDEVDTLSRESKRITDEVIPLLKER